MGKITTGKRLSGRKRKMPLMASAVVLAALAATAVAAAPAQAYKLTGCHWGSANIRLDVRSTYNQYRTAINQASANYTSATDVNLSNVTVSGPAFTAANAAFGKTGSEGNTTWLCRSGGATYSSHTTVNNSYLSSAPTARIKVVWLHEIGHGLGLHHVTGGHVMNESASNAYTAYGVRNLTADEVSGINRLY